jgi:hypothetical protein
LRRENTICNSLLDRIYTHFNGVSANGVVDEKQTHCENMALNLVARVTELLKHADDQYYNQRIMVSITNGIYSAHLIFNRECAGMIKKFTLPNYDLKSIYYFGLAIKSESDKSAEALYVENCKTRIDTMIDIVEKGEDGFKDLNHFDLIMISHTELRKLIGAQRKENTICNSLLDRVNSHFTNGNEPIEGMLQNRRPEREECINIANSVVVSVNEIINKSEDPNIIKEEGILVNLATTLSSLISKFNGECVGNTGAKYDLLALYTFGLQIHAEISEEDKPEEMYLKSCKDRVNSIVSLIQQELITNNNLSAVIKVTTVSLKLKELLNNLRRENSICNQLMDRVYNHFQLKGN